MINDFSILGKTVRLPTKHLEIFPAPGEVEEVTLTSDEMTSLCPVTGQPDFDTVTIKYKPQASCIESKSLKLYLWSYREEGVFCEALSQQIADDIFEACKPVWVQVEVLQKSRGGITIRSIARRQQ